MLNFMSKNLRSHGYLTKPPSLLLFHVIICIFAKNHTIMEKALPKDVKSMVSDDLKKRHLNQQAIAHQLGISRQSVASILSSGDFFSEKQAAMFCNAFGYNREFLVAGLGGLINEKSPHGLSDRVHHLEKALLLYQKIVYTARIVNGIVIKEGSEKSAELLQKTKQLYDFVTVLETNKSIFPEGIMNPPIDSSIMDKAEELLQVILKDVSSYIFNKYDGMDVDFSNIMKEL